MIKEQYAEQVQLLVKLLPAVAAEKQFALKGVTAINLFYRNLPRLSADIDLTYLPIKDRRQSLSEIDAAMDRIGTSGESLPGIRATRIPGGRGAATRVLFQHGAVGVKVETSPVTRGVVFAPQTKRV